MEMDRCRACQTACPATDSISFLRQVWHPWLDDAGFEDGLDACWSWFWTKHESIFSRS